MSLMQRYYTFIRSFLLFFRSCLHPFCHASTYARHDSIRSEQRDVRKSPRLERLARIIIFDCFSILRTIKLFTFFDVGNLARRWHVPPFLPRLELFLSSTTFQLPFSTTPNSTLTKGCLQLGASITQRRLE